MDDAQVHNMAKGKYFQALAKFPPEDRLCFEAVKRDGRLSMSFDTPREMRSVRLRLYRYIDALQHFEPRDPLAKWLNGVEIGYTLEPPALEIRLRGNKAQQDALKYHSTAPISRLDEQLEMLNNLPGGLGDLYKEEDK